MNSYVKIEQVSKSFLVAPGQVNEKVNVINNFTLAMTKGELVTLFGPNGCGKTTLLHLVCGILQPDEGTISIGERSPENCRIALIFQNYRDSLYPWRTALDNVAFPLEGQGVPKKNRRRIAHEFMQQLSIQIPEESYPYQLSGGQQQLVAIARGLIDQPELLLMDEPFGALDYQTRLFMHDKILEIWRNTGMTILFVSHEIDEAIYLADRTILLSKRPARIMNAIKNTLPRPRTHGLLRTEEFHILRSRALEVIEEAIQK